MIFNSISFLVFLAVVLALYYRMEHRAQNRLLLAASYFFYGWWDPRFLGLLVLSSSVDYACALRIEAAARPATRRFFLALSLTVNLGILGFFKYFDFFAASAARVLGLLGMDATWPLLHVILPVGVSFYTFQSLSYTVDVYRGHMKASRRLDDCLLYVALFPQLVAGPIERASHLLPQCARPRQILSREVTTGLWLILLGYVKKTVIADRLGQIADLGFASATPLFADANAWLVLYAFAFQIYADFSGYSDIARGVAKLMGFDLMLNFRAPYLVSGPSEFWRHWHISLSTWLRDYLYIPLGGNRRGEGARRRNLLTTMVLGGLWHGAGAAYVLWGLYHGLLLIGQRWKETLFRSREERAPPAPAFSSVPAPASLSRRLRAAVGAAVFFHVICLGWLLFRAGALPRGISQVLLVSRTIRSLVTPCLPGDISPLAWPVALLGVLALVFQWKHEAMDRFADWAPSAKVAALVAALAALVSLGVFEGAQFIYFQF